MTIDHQTDRIREDLRIMGERARQAIDHYARELHGGYLDWADDPQAVLVDLLADLAHWSAEHTQMSWADALACAADHVAEERADIGI